jgi:hypothetical protein
MGRRFYVTAICTIFCVPLVRRLAGERRTEPITA